MFNVWKDFTSEEDEAARALQEEAILAEQELLNKMAARNYERAVELCIKWVPVRVWPVVFVVGGRVVVGGWWGVCVGVWGRGGGRG